MLELYFQLPADFRIWVLDYLQAFILSLSDELAITVDTGEDDPELIMAWAEGLSNDLIADTDELFALLCDEHFGEEKQVVTIPAAEGILRASSALRLKIQQNLLKKLSEHALEDGLVESGNLSIGERQAYQCYLFLAALQVSILQALDPALKDLCE